MHVQDRSRWIVVVVAALMLAEPAAGGGFLTNEKPNASTTEPKQRPQYAAPAARKPVEGEPADAWEAKLHNAQLRVTEAQQNANAAAWALRRARTRRYPRGEGLQALRNDSAEMNQERDAAETAFTETLEEARRAGVPAGILSGYMDFETEMRRTQQARQTE